MNRDFGFLILSLILWGIGEGSFFSFIPLYLQELGAKAFQIGGIMGGLSFAAMLCHLPAGYLADKFGRRTLIIASYLIGFGATCLMFLSNSLTFFALSLFLYGATAFVLAPMNSYVAHTAPQSALNRLFTLLSASYNVGYMIGPIIGGFLGEYFGLRNLFIYAAGLFLLSTLLVFPISPQPTIPSPKGMAFFRSIFNLNFSSFIFVIALTIFAVYLPIPLSPNYLQNQKLLSLTSIGFLFFVNGSGIVTFNLLLGTFAPFSGILASQLLTILFCLLLLYTNSIATFAFAFFIVGSFRAAHTLSAAQLRYYIQPESMGLAYGFAESVFALAMILASFFAGYLYENDPTAMYSMSILLTMVALAFTLGFIFLTRSRAKKSNPNCNPEGKLNELSISESEQAQ